MNRTGRTRLENAVHNFDRKLRQALHLFTDEMEDMLYDENTKLANVPEPLRDTSQSENYSTAIEMIEEVLKNTEAIETSLDDVLTAADVSSDFVPEKRQTKVSTGRKGVNFHAILPSEMMGKLKRESMVSGLSMNEILCRALRDELEEKPKIPQKSSKRA